MATNRAIILAAGASERLGMHKALVEVGDETLVELVCKKLQRSNLKVTIVTRNSLEKSIQALLPEANVVVNPNPELGRTGTVQYGIRTIGVGPVLIVPVDRPGFSISTVDTLCRMDETTTPAFQGRGGHPIALTSNDCEVILEAKADIPLRDLIDASKFEVGDSNLHIKIDTHDDVEQLLKVVNSL